MRRILIAAALTVAPISSSAQGLVGDPDAGRTFALRNCSTCHVVADRNTRRTTDAAPSFASIARSTSTTELSLRVYLQTPHPPMPDFALTRRDIDDVVSYIMSLRGR